MDNLYHSYFQEGERNFKFASPKLANLVSKEKTIKISPQKGFVIKAYEKNGGKVYFNILSSNLIAEFHLKKMPDLNDNEGLRIPLSIGEEKQREDKKGQKYKTYDIVLNTKVVSQSKKNLELKKVIAELVQVAIKNKYNTDTCANLFFFPEHKYKGSSPDDQFIKDDQQHKFNVVEEASNEAGGATCEGEQLNQEDIQNFLSVKKPEWDMWFVDKKTFEERYERMEMFYLPYLRTSPLNGTIDCFDFKPPFMSANGKQKEKISKMEKTERKEIKNNAIFRSFLNEYNIELDDDFLRYQQVINTICVIQIQLPFFIVTQRSDTRGERRPFAVHEFVNLYIADDHLAVFFKKSPLFPAGHNPPYKNFNIRFPFYFESSKAVSQYLERYHLLNIIIPVSRSSATCRLFSGKNMNNGDDVLSDNAETSDSSIF
ncbi:Uncharacterized protein PCOAH_00053300 [Plasmodium coatneyi]|uniref:PIH1 N-terminal domain-containing protein n=1 Tax=Plasmodium coatneyi TaxID=208452 RepID=A0A1B1E6Y1_9APIC|nr:Uncharacterized protein PCOAH_00053300 [Plasmodium coatneyi]ANQ10786.1 Uncharacterized protein PCOAH_00053300 [Plasmodium coatneyi]